MILAALAVIATVGVLIIVHTPQQIEPSYTLRKICNVLCRFVCMKNLYNEIDCSLSHSDIRKIKEAKTMKTSDSKEQCDPEIIEVNNGNRKEDDEEEDYSEEYAFYALVIDRTLFWLFLFLNIILMITLLAIYPSFSTAKDIEND